MRSPSPPTPAAPTACGAISRTTAPRAQLALAGLHIVNDRLYGAFAVEKQTGHCLHALSAEFTHPVSGDPVVIRTALPDWARL